MPAERLQKVLARAGLGSRREIEDWIRAGRLAIDGVIAELGVQVTGKETILLDGRPITAEAPESVRVLAYHKPIGELSTRRDPEGRATVFDRLPRLARGRWISVGRLDINTCGLLLLTNDGELCNRLMHPSRQLEREYAVRVFGDIDALLLERLLEGVQLDDGPARFTAIRDAGGRGVNHWYHVILNEGRHREVRRLWESQGVQVNRLIRVRYGPIELGRRLPSGQCRELTAQEIDLLREAAGLPKDKSCTRGTTTGPGRSAARSKAKSKPKARPKSNPNSRRRPR